jgi:hypothetical protein
MKKNSLIKMMLLACISISTQCFALTVGAPPEAYPCYVAQKAASAGVRGEWVAEQDDKSFFVPFNNFYEGSSVFRLNMNHVAANDKSSAAERALPLLNTLKLNECVKKDIYIVCYYDYDDVETKTTGWLWWKETKITNIKATIHNGANLWIKEI